MDGFGGKDRVSIIACNNNILSVGYEVNDERSSGRDRRPRQTVSFVIILQHFGARDLNLESRVINDAGVMFDNDAWRSVRSGLGPIDSRPATTKNSWEYGRVRGYTTHP